MCSLSGLVDGTDGGRVNDRAESLNGRSSVPGWMGNVNGFINMWQWSRKGAPVT